MDQHCYVNEIRILFYIIQIGTANLWYGENYFWHGFRLVAIVIQIKKIKIT